jgi:uncharacterized membrane protein HdeD (DUF308 family)
MHIIIGIAAAVALLYYWLLGHWFARILTTIVFVPLFFFIGMVSIMVLTDQKDMPASFAFGIIGAVLAWPAASAPVWYWRRALGINS